MATAMPHGGEERETWCREKMDFVCAVVSNVDRNDLRTQLEICETEDEAEALLQSLLWLQDNEEAARDHFEDAGAFCDPGISDGQRDRPIPGAPGVEFESPIGFESLGANPGGCSDSVGQASHSGGTGNRIFVETEAVLIDLQEDDGVRGGVLGENRIATVGEDNNIIQGESGFILHGHERNATQCVTDNNINQITSPERNIHGNEIVVVDDNSDAQVGKDNRDNKKVNESGHTSQINEHDNNGDNRRMQNDDDNKMSNTVPGEDNSRERLDNKGVKLNVDGNAGCSSESSQSKETVIDKGEEGVNIVIEVVRVGFKNDGLSGVAFNTNNDMHESDNPNENRDNIRRAPIVEADYVIVNMDNGMISTSDEHSEISDTGKKSGESLVMASTSKEQMGNSDGEIQNENTATGFASDGDDDVKIIGVVSGRQVLDEITLSSESDVHAPLNESDNHALFSESDKQALSDDSDYQALLSDSDNPANESDNQVLWNESDNQVLSNESEDNQVNESDDNQVLSNESDDNQVLSNESDNQARGLFQDGEEEEDFNNDDDDDDEEEENDSWFYSLQETLSSSDEDLSDYSPTRETQGAVNNVNSDEHLARRIKEDMDREERERLEADERLAREITEEMARQESLQEARDAMLARRLAEELNEGGDGDIDDGDLVVEAGSVNSEYEDLSQHSQPTLDDEMIARELAEEGAVGGIENTEEDEELAKRLEEEDRNVPPPADDGKSMQLAELMTIFPDADPQYLRVRCEANVTFAQLVEDLIELQKSNPRDPRISGYLKRQQEARAVCTKRQRTDMPHTSSHYGYQEVASGSSTEECSICFEDNIATQQMASCNGRYKFHYFCIECVRKHVRAQIGFGNNVFRCMNGYCEAEFSYGTLSRVMEPVVLEKVQERRQQEEVERAGIENLVACPFCNFMVIMEDPNNKVLVCLNPECEKESCRLCRRLAHIPLRCEEVEYDNQKDARVHIENKMSEALIRTCPNCKKSIVSEGGCNKMTCACGTSMCYVCRQIIANGYDHFTGGQCPQTSDLENLHSSNVREAASRARQEVDPDVNLVHDPTKDVL